MNYLSGHCLETVSIVTVAWQHLNYFACRNHFHGDSFTKCLLVGGLQTVSIVTVSVVMVTIFEF